MNLKWTWLRSRLVLRKSGCVKTVTSSKSRKEIKMQNRLSLVVWATSEGVKANARSLARLRVFLVGARAEATL